MKLFIKITTMISLIATVSAISFAQNSNEAVGNKSKTSSSMSNSGTSTTTNPNATTGTTVESGTVPNAGNNFNNTGARTNVSPNAPVIHQLTLQGIKAQDQAKIVQFARQAGASEAKVEGNILKYSGTSFNQDRFSTLVSGSLPDVNVTE
jgi:hypothetical protein